MLDFLIRSLYNLSMLEAVKIGILRKSQYNDEGFLVKMYLEWRVHLLKQFLAIHLLKKGIGLQKT